MINNIESPLYSFNNVMIKIIADFEKEFNITNLAQCIIFQDDVITLFGWLKIYQRNNVILMKILKELDYSDLTLVNQFHEKFEFIARQYYIYLMMYNRIAKGCDDVPTKVIDNIINDINTNKFEGNKYLLPFKNKLSELDKSLNIYEKFELMLTIHKGKYPGSLTFRIKKCMSSDLNESISINNIKYLDIDTISEKNILFTNIEKYLTDLYFYGKV